MLFDLELLKINEQTVNYVRGRQAVCACETNLKFSKSSPAAVLVTFT